MTTLTLLALVGAGPALAADPCDLAVVIPPSALEVPRYTDRAFLAYKNRDVKASMSARRELACALARQEKPLAAYEVAKVHLAFAADAGMTGRDASERDAYVRAAIAADCGIAASAPRWLGDEGAETDALVERVQTLSKEACGDDPDAAAGASGAEGEPPAGTVTLPPPWRANLWLNGEPGDTAAAPYFLQVVNFRGEPTSSGYVEIGGEIPAYHRLRPRIGGMIAGSAAAAAVTFAAGAAIAGRVEPWEAPQGKSLAGAAVSDSLESWTRRGNAQRTANHALLAASGGFGLVTLGLGAWWVTSF